MKRPPSSRTSITAWLERSDPWVLNTYAMACAFATYFCMYAFRKPFSAATYEAEGLSFFGWEMQAKSAFIVTQLLGYALSKYVGVRVNSEVSRAQRLRLLVGLIVVAELALVVFGALPEGANSLKAVALFANGLPLGMVWGLVVQYLEGRQMSEVLLTGLSCSYIVASGVVKDIGRGLLEGWGPFGAVSDFWMPAATGALFFPAFLLFAWLLEQTPEPSLADEAARTRREPMRAHERREFFTRYAVAITTALAAFFVLTAFRDYRDTYSVELYTELQYAYEDNRTIISRAEMLVALGVMAALSQLYRFRDNRRGLVATYSVMTAGLLLIGGATLLLDTGRISGFWWMTLIGFGAYVAYIPFGSVLFERALACSGFVGTAVFGIYISDAIGYTGSVAFYLTADSLLGSSSHLGLMRMLSYVVAFGGSALLVASCAAFVRGTVAREGEFSEQQLPIS